MSIRTEHEILSRPHKTQTYSPTDLLSFYSVSVNKSYILKYIGYNLKVYHHRHVPKIVTDHSQAVFHKTPKIKPAISTFSDLQYIIKTTSCISCVSKKLFWFTRSNIFNFFKTYKNYENHQHTFRKFSSA